jgi:hypothetical protein
MQRRHFVRNVGLASLTPLVAACSRTLAGPLAALRPTNTVDAKQCAASHCVWNEAVAYARWAPSPHNIQPWRLRVLSETTAELLYDPARLLPVTDPTSAFTIMGLAMFVEYLSIAMQPTGFAVRAEYVMQPLNYGATALTRFATLTRVPTTDAPAFDRELIMARQTSRLPYDGYTVDDATLHALASLSSADGHAFHWSSDDATVAWMLDLNRFTLFRDLDDAPTRGELRQWIRSTPDEAFVKKDGLWSHCLRFPGWLLKAFFDEHEKWGRGWRAKICGRMLVQGMNGTRTVGWWSGPLETPADWIRAGSLLGRSWLALSERGINMHPFGSVITNPEAYAKLCEKLKPDTTDGPLWLAVRLGRSAAPPRSYRLSAHNILVTSEKTPERTS